MSKIKKDEHETKNAIKDDEIVTKEVNKALRPLKALSSVFWSSIVIFDGMLISYQTQRTIVGSKDYLSNKKFIPKIANELNVDMQIMNGAIRKNLFSRLKPNSNNKVYVYIDKSVSSRAKDNIINSLDYFNDVMGVFTDRYNFEVCDKSKFLLNKHISNSTIKFSYSGLNEYTYGQNSVNPGKTIINEAFGSSYDQLYLVDSNIKLNGDFFDKLSDRLQRSVIRHELLHALGFGDTYEGYNDKTSLINTKFQRAPYILGPNDMRMLATAYCESLIDENGNFNESKLTEIKNYLEEYEKYYYKELMDLIVEGTEPGFESISKEDLADFRESLVRVNIKVDDNLNFECTTRKDNETTKGKVILGDYYAIVPNVVVNYENDFYVIVKVDGKLKAYNVWQSLIEDKCQDSSDFLLSSF